jgi:methylated-DNA-[protein]-cysteine S-methyltransferase
MRTVSVHLLDTPLGPLKVALGEGRIVALGLPGEPRNFVTRLRERFLGAEVRWEVEPSEAATGRLLAELARQVGLYAARLRHRFSLPMAPRGTPFQRRVWGELSRIPFGERRTYAEVGAALGSVRLARAVGGACARNPLPLLIPCHRVVASGGGLGGYSGGLEVKRLLLDLESSR